MTPLAKAIQFTVLVIASAFPLVGEVVKVGTCAVDSELLILPDCAVVNRSGNLYIVHGFLRTFFSDGGFGIAVSTVMVEGHRLAWSDIPHAGWAYFNRNGLVVVKNVATMDNGASQFHHGLVRVTISNKWGLANIRGEMVVPMTYDGILEYEESYGWRVCSGCRTESDGEHSWFVGGKWQWLDQKGRLSGEAPDPMVSRNE